MYEPTQAPLKAEVVRMVGELESSVLQLLDFVIDAPTTLARSALRGFSNRVNAVFHALEILRPVEAREMVGRVMIEDENTDATGGDGYGKVWRYCRGIGVKREWLSVVKVLVEVEWVPLVQYTREGNRCGVTSMFMRECA